MSGSTVPRCLGSRALGFRVPAALVGAWLSVWTLAAQQPPFRSGIDLIAVDVQVVDAQGRPIQTLDARNFEVDIEGRRRRIVSADLLQFTEFLYYQF